MKEKKNKKGLKLACVGAVICAIGAIVLKLTK